MIHVHENSVQGWSCPVCGWGTLTTYIDKIHQDMTEYSIYTKSIANIDKDKIKVIAFNDLHNHRKTIPTNFNQLKK